MGPSASDYTVISWHYAALGLLSSLVRENFATWMYFQTSVVYYRLLRTKKKQNALNFHNIKDAIKTFYSYQFFGDEIKYLMIT